MAYSIEQNTIVPSTCSSGKRKRSLLSGNVMVNQGMAMNVVPPRKVVRVMSALPSRMIPSDSSCNPQELLATILSKDGIASDVYSIDRLPLNFFEASKEEEVNAYGFDVIRAIRESDIETLRSFLQQGRPLKCSNQFGESLLHLACRKGLVQVVEFLIHEAGVPLRVVDDVGRSPMHDAFWTCEPNFALVDLLVRKCPDLLYVSDKRGHTPLAYARRNHWGKWSEYIHSRGASMLAPTILGGQLKQ